MQRLSRGSSSSTKKTHLSCSLSFHCWSRWKSTPMINYTLRVIMPRRSSLYSRVESRCTTTTIMQWIRGSQCWSPSICMSKVLISGTLKFSCRMGLITGIALPSHSVKVNYLLSPERKWWPSLRDSRTWRSKWQRWVLSARSIMNGLLHKLWTAICRNWLRKRPVRSARTRSRQKNLSKMPSRKACTSRAITLNQAHSSKHKSLK